MSNRDRDGFPMLWVLVDKRGSILDHDMWGLHNFGMCQLCGRRYQPFPGTVWANRSSARTIRDLLRSRMSKEAWKTWQFKPVGYKRL